MPPPKAKLRDRCIINTFGLIDAKLQSQIRDICPFRISNRVANATGTQPVLHILFTAEVRRSAAANSWNYGTLLLRLLANGKTDLREITGLDNYHIKSINKNGIIAATGDPVGDTGPTAINHALILLPVEVLAPELDASGAPVDPNGTAAATKLVDGTKRLKVAQWENAYDDSAYVATVKEEFIKYDPDRFYIRIPNIGTSGHPMKVELSTLGRDGAVMDEAKEVVLVSYTTDTSYVKSLAHILVSDDTDDQFSGKGAGVDEGSLDRTHKVEVGGKLKITITIGTQTGEVTIPVPQTEKIKTVKVKAIIVRNTTGGVAPATIEQVREDIAVNVCQRLAQINMRAELDGDPVFMDPPVGPRYDFTAGVIQNETENLFQGNDVVYKAIQEGQATANGETYYVFYVKAFVYTKTNSDGSKTLAPYALLGFAYPAADNITFLRKAFVAYKRTSDDGELPIVTAHELLHMVTGLGHYTDDDYPLSSKPNSDVNLMRDHPTSKSPTGSETVAVCKRLFNSQKELIRKNVP